MMAYCHFTIMRNMESKADIDEEIAMKSAHYELLAFRVPNAFLDTTTMIAVAICAHSIDSRTTGRVSNSRDSKSDLTLTLRTSVYISKIWIQICHSMAPVRLHCAYLYATLVTKASVLSYTLYAKCTGYLSLRWIHQRTFSVGWLNVVIFLLVHMSPDARALVC